GRAGLRSAGGAEPPGLHLQPAPGPHAGPAAWPFGEAVLGDSPPAWQPASLSDRAVPGGRGPVRYACGIGGKGAVGHGDPGGSQPHRTAVALVRAVLRPAAAGPS